MPNSQAIKAKIARLRAGNAPRVLDLFSGCGGLSLGFKAAGFEITAAMEFDAAAARSHGTNFHPGDERHARARDITVVKARELVTDLELGDPASAFDLIIGGPPCQAFARVGRSKLREVAEHPEAFRHDTRARLYIEYLQYVEDCAPLAVVMENVPDMMNHGGHNLAEEISDVLNGRGYSCGYTLLNAAFYGVPQMRERMFLVAVRKELASNIIFPYPNHWVRLPSGYGGSRQVALKLLDKADLFGGSGFYRDPPLAQPTLPPAVTAKEALDDLPNIFARTEVEVGTLKRGARRFDAPLPYPEDSSQSSFAEQMRNWPGFEAKNTINDHVIRYLPRDYNLFARLSPGDQFPEAFRQAEVMFNEALNYEATKGCRPRKNSKRWAELRSSIVPPYDPDKFPNKWRKMEADQPSRTLLAHLGKDSYSHIHYCNDQARTISVREAARLQSFPDGFIFCGTMNPAFRQIGNAVPPLLAKAVAESVAQMLPVALSDRIKLAGAA